MIPLRDNVGEGGAPPQALILIGLIAAAGLAIPGGSWLTAVVALIGAWLFAPTPVRRFGVLPVLVIAAAGGALGGWIAAAAGSQPGDWSAPAAAAAVAAVHLSTNRGAAVLTLVAIPYRATLTEIASPLVAASWAMIGTAAITLA